MTSYSLSLVLGGTGSLRLANHHFGRFDDRHDVRPNLDAQPLGGGTCNNGNEVLPPYVEPDLRHDATEADRCDLAPKLVPRADLHLRLLLWFALPDPDGAQHGEQIFPG